MGKICNYQPVMCQIMCKSKIRTWLLLKADRMYYVICQIVTADGLQGPVTYFVLLTLCLLSECNIRLFIKSALILLIFLLRTLLFGRTLALT